MKTSFIIIALILSLQSKEIDYQVPFCKNLNGIIEYVLPDKSRVDCLTNEYAIEVDFAKKWAESIGQSLFYALMTDKKPAVAIIAGDQDKRYLKRLYKVTNKLNIKTFIINK